MNLSALSSFAQSARTCLLAAVEQRARFMLGSGSLPGSLGSAVSERGLEQVCEAAAQLWFHRLCALRCMEARGWIPETLSAAGQDGGRRLVLAQCTRLSAVLPLSFGPGRECEERLLPDMSRGAEGLPGLFVHGLPPEEWRGNVELLGWLHQFYAGEQRGRIGAGKLSSRTLSAITQRFTPRWLAQLLIQNSMGRVWLSEHPDSALRGSMPYRLDAGECAGQVSALPSPESYTLLDPCCGSGQVLVEAYDLLRG